MRSIKMIQRRKLWIICMSTVTTVKNAGSVQLVPATYQFDLSDGGINIANMSLVRDRRGGSVMTIFEIDQPVPAAELEQLKAVPQVLGVIYYEKEDD